MYYICRYFQAYQKMSNIIETDSETNKPDAEMITKDVCTTFL